MELFDKELYNANKNIVAVVMGHFFLRYLNRLYHEFDGDLLLPVVLGEIAHHNIFKFYSRNGQCAYIRDKLLTRKEKFAKLEPTNAFSISEATGIPRETVRRKIDKLVEKGWIVKYPRGEVTISEAVDEHFLRDFNTILLSELLETAECIKNIVSAPEALPK
ncbi:hypothetical protein [Desulfosarcina sp.]|uniref:hypothetical protein n=1 Tax=Desulfosarcina sp. TaxID=2027861 RepID=UPI0039709098